jgi:hypothetical protein
MEYGAPTQNLGNIQGAPCLHDAGAERDSPANISGQEASDDLLATTCARWGPDDVYVERCRRLERVAARLRWSRFDA